MPPKILNKAKKLISTKVDVLNKRPKRAKLLRKTEEDKSAQISNTDDFKVEKILQELQVHQIELETQNETLRQAQIELEESRARYMDLYDFAPVGYITLNTQAQITEINFTGAALLGVEKPYLLKQRFAPFIVPEDQNGWYRHFLLLLQHDIKQNCEVILQRQDGTRLDVRLDSLRLTHEGHVLGVRVVVSDITERKLAARKLEEERGRAQMYLDTVQTVIVALDKSGMITMINRAGCKLLGYRESELIGLNWFEKCLLQPEGMTDVFPKYQQIFTVNLSAAEYYEYHVVCSNGSTRLIAWHNSYTTDDNNNIVGIISSGQDITEQKRMEAQLYKLAQAVEQSRESVIITNLDAEIEYVNDAFVEKSGYSRAEVIGKNPRLLHSGKTPSETHANLWNTLAEGQIWKGELNNRSKDGTEYTEFASITPIRQADGHISHYVAVKEDITERKQIAIELDRHRYHLEVLVQQRTTELKEANNKLLDTQFAMESVGIAIHWVDVDTGQFIEVNKFAADMLGYTVEEMLGKKVPDIDPNFPIDTFRNIADRLRQQGKAQIETFHLSKDGRLIPVEVTIYYLPAKAENLDRFIAFVTDITKRKEIQNDLILAKELAESATRAKSAFLANMSHEIRTPMNGVVGMVDILQQTSLNAEQQRMLNTIQDSSLALLHIINDILDFSKIEADMLIMESLPVRLREVAEEVALLLATMANRKNLELLLFVSPKLPVWIVSDPVRLRQILFNLLGNAMKFTSNTPQGRVILYLEPCSMPDSSRGLRIRILDNGIGMSDETINSLFTPFTQLIFTQSLHCRTR